jgi:hypothetical protein
MKDFHEAFSTESWNQLHRTDKIRHVVLKCKECVKSHPEFKLKKINIVFTRTVLSSEARTPQALQPINVSIEHNERTPQQRLTVNNIPLNIKKQIIKESRQEQDKDLIQPNKRALFSETMSVSSYERQRMAAHSTHIQHAKKAHIGPLDSYAFDRDRVRTELEEQADENKDLSDRMNRRWSRLARHAGLKAKDGKTLNASQVCFH